MTTYPAWQAGQRITAGRLRSGQPDWTSKPSDEPIASSTTLQADDHLTSPVLGGSAYTFVAQLFIGSGSSDADIRVGFDFPAGSVCHFGGTGAHPGALTSGTSGVVDFFPMRAAAPGGGGDTFLAFGISSAFNTWVRIEGTLVAAADGDLTLMWAQNASDATETRVLAGSSMEVRRRS
ncbi:hypothetical protein ACWC5I_21670 [Kitasatospora sp. NPDC001574]